MPQSLSQLYAHLVFSTKDRFPFLKDEVRDRVHGDLTKALTLRDRIRLQPSGTYALNLLGMSEQVPAKVVFLTEGDGLSSRTGSSITWLSTSCWTRLNCMSPRLPM